MLKIGAILRDKYRILATPARGMSGSTYLAENINDSTTCAIKELDPQLSNPESYQEISSRFRDEADYLRRLDGFNGQIPRFYETLKGKDSLDIEREYIVQEYIEGKTLGQYAQDMRAQGWTLSQSQVKEILCKLLPVVAHIHEAGFIHRDINPRNIILRATNRIPVLIDFGAVKEYEITLLRQAGQTLVIGTEGYQDQDQLNGNPSVASDLYALGAVAVFLLTNVPPKTIRTKDGKLLWADLVVGLSKDFFNVIDKAIEPGGFYYASYQGQRFGSARAMLEALNHAATGDELEEELTQLASRRSRDTLPKSFVKCRECAWYLATDEKNCTNCGAYNAELFTADEKYLFSNTPEAYLEHVRDTFLTRDVDTTALVKLNKDEYNLISNSLGAYIKKHTAFYNEKIPPYLVWDGKPLNDNIPNHIASDALQALGSIPNGRPFGITLAEYLHAYKTPLKNFGMAMWICAGLATGLVTVIGILTEYEHSLCFAPCGAIIVAVIAVSTRNFVGEILDSIISVLLADKKDAAVKLKNYYELKKTDRKILVERLREHASSTKKVLEERFQWNSAGYRASKFYLKRDEDRITSRLASIETLTRKLTEIADMLDKDIKAFPSDLPADELKMQRERTSSVLKQLSLQALKYSAKLQEIELLRLFNAMQAEIPKQQVTPQVRKETKEKIDKMAKLSEAIYGKLQKAELTDAGSERLWLERIKLIREALMNSHKRITFHIADLAHNGQDDKVVDFPLEVNMGLEKVSTLLTNEDFEKDYQILQARYEK